MQAVIKNFKFKGYKKFSDWVELNFEVNPNKYAIKDYLKSFAYDGVNVLHYNAITGIIGSNSSGKTSTLEIIEQYAKYLQSGISPFGTGANADFDARNHHERHRPATMPTPSQMREFFKSKMSKIFGAANSFNAKNDVIEMVVEIAIEGAVIKHECEFRLDGRISERFYFKKRINKNETTQLIFSKTFEQEISFRTFASLLESDEIIVSNRLANVSQDDVKKAAQALYEISTSIVDTEQSDLPFFKLSSNVFFDNIKSDDDLLSRVGIMQEIIRLMDTSIKEVKISPTFNNQYIEFDFHLNDGTVVRESSISTGTIKFTSLVLKALYLYKKDKGHTKYILVDEIDNSWHPNLTKTFLQIFKLPFLKDFNLICTFHNPYISTEFREDSLYLTTINGPITWVQFINDHNKEHANNKIRLEHSFARKYLEDLLTSIDISEAIVSNLIQEIEKVDLN
jgi:hypothetical protein